MCLKKLLLGLATLLILVALAPPVRAPQPSETYYELVERWYIIGEDRSISDNENYTIYNPSWFAQSYEITYPIPTENTRDVNVWSDSSISYEVSRGGGTTAIKLNFSVSGRSRLTYHISYVADGWVSGSGPRYRATLGGVTLGPNNFAYHRYIVRVRGPAGSKLFLKNPDDAQLLENDPPIVQYETSVSAPGSFGGLEAHFYTQPAYFKLALTERFVNQSTGVSKNVTFDTILFAHSPSQFAAFAGANLPVKTMYLDDENNWHGVFDVGDIQPGQSKDLNIGFVYVENVYTPDISKNDVGAIADVPSGLSSYLEAREYWEVNDPAIGWRADQIVGTEKKAYEVARKIVEYVSNYVTYEVTSPRKGALETLSSGRGDCDCFSDLTIALSRAVGLPARMDFGWGYQENLVGHAWVEFYLPGKGWQPADPTWAKSSGDYLFKLDPIHLLRYVRGISSSESASKYTWYDVQPSVEGENVTLLSLTKSEAAQALIQAGESTINVASNLLASHPNEALAQELDFARARLEQAKVASDENAILLAQEAVRHANTVVEALGKPPETGFIFPIDPRYLVLILAVLISVAGVAAIWIHKRRA